MRRHTRQGKSELSSLITATQFRVQSADLPKNADAVLHPTAKRCPHHPFPRFPSLRATEKTLATGRVAQHVTILDLLLFQELKPFDRNAVKTMNATFPSN